MSIRLPILLLVAVPVISACGGAADQDRAAQSQAQPPAEQAQRPSAQAQLPSDIHPVTLSRLPPPTPEDLDEEGQRLLAARANVRPGPGPGQFQLYHPDSRSLGIPDGEDSPVGARLFQLATMIAARHLDQEYEWASHAVRGYVQGVEQEIIDAVKYDRDVTGLSDKDATLITFGRTLLRENGVSSELWQRMVGHYGRQQTVQLLQTMVAYLRIGIMLNAVDQQNPEFDDAWWTARGCVAECKEHALASQLQILPPLPGRTQWQSQPSEIHPVTLSRLPPPTPEDLDEEGQRLLAARPNFRAGPGPGQFGLYNPDSRDLGIPDGEGSPVGARFFQLATLIVARELDQEYEWASHAVRGFVQGVDQEVIDAVKYDRDVSNLSDKDATFITFGRTLLRENGVSSELWQRMVGHFGRQQTVQLLQIMAAYYRVGILMNAVDQQNPEFDDAWWTARGCVAECKETAMAAQLQILPPLAR